MVSVLLPTYGSSLTWLITLSLFSYCVLVLVASTIEDVVFSVVTFGVELGITLVMLVTVLVAGSVIGVTVSDDTSCTEVDADADVVLPASVSDAVLDVASLSATLSDSIGVVTLSSDAGSVTDVTSAEADCPLKPKK